MHACIATHCPDIRVHQQHNLGERQEVYVWTNQRRSENLMKCRTKCPLCLDTFSVELHRLCEMQWGGRSQLEPRREQLMNETQIHAHVRGIELLFRVVCAYMR